MPGRGAKLTCVTLLLLSCTAALSAQDNPLRSVPRIELGAVLSAASQSDIGNYFHWGGGGRVTVNVTRYLAGEIESTRQPTGLGPYYPPEVHTAIAAKGTYRAEQRRWLRFAGLNFFGVIGPGFVNRSVQVEGIPAGLPPGTFCFPYGCTVQRRQTATMLDYGGGFEVVPARPVAIRFDVTHASFSQPYLFSNFSQTFDQHRTYLKVALMLRLN